jgi:hypothetical protein
MLIARLKDEVNALEFNSIFEYQDVKLAINYLKEKVDGIDSYELKTFNIEYTEEDTGELAVAQTTTFIKLNDNAYVRLIKTIPKNRDEEIIDAAAVFLGEEDGVPRVFTTSFKNGEILYDVDGPYNEKAFNIPEKEEVKTTVAYLDCVWGGTCCTLSGVKYKWCGAGCGSGTPINALDTCCRWHDDCYTANKSYPARCVCDAVLNRCADTSGVDGAGILISAFIAKMAWYGC